MSHPSFCFENVRLDDASYVKQANLGMLGFKTVKDTRRTLQQLSERCGRLLWLVLPGKPAAGSANELETDTDADAGADTDAEAGTREQDNPGGKTERDAILALLGFQVIDPEARRALVWLFPGETSMTDDLLSLIVDKAFSTVGLYRLEIAITPQDQDWIPALTGTGWRQEAIMVSCHWNEARKRHEDVRMFSMIRPWQRTIGIAFIPFAKGIVALTGDVDGVTASEFVRYGQPAESDRLQESAEWLDLLDGQGRFLSEQDILAHLAGKTWIGTDHLSEPVRDAADQIADYFLGKKNDFDVKIHFEQGSPFQQRVWTALQQIPFGTTWTYEDLASSISNQDRVQGRKMARAVGSACGANPLPLILPCHRVIGKNGHLVGFSGGLDIKAYLLGLELLGLS